MSAALVPGEAVRVFDGETKEGRLVGEYPHCFLIRIRGKLGYYKTCINKAAVVCGAEEIDVKRNGTWTRFFYHNRLEGLI